MSNSLSNMELLVQGIYLEDEHKIRKALSKSPELLNDKVEYNKTLDGMLYLPLSVANQYQNREISPLWYAVLRGNEKIVDILMREFGANPNNKCKAGIISVVDELTFIEAFMINVVCDMWVNNNFEMLEVFIKNGAYVHKIYEQLNFNIFQLALYKGNIKLVELLLKNGVRLNMPEWQGKFLETLTFSCNTSNFKELIFLLMEYGIGPLDCHNHEGKNILHYFSLYKKDSDDVVKLVEFLVHSIGIPIDSVDQRGFTPLHYASFSGNMKLTLFLIERGAKITAKNCYGQTPLLLACYAGHENVAHFLLQKGANIDDKQIDGVTVFGVTKLEFDPIYKKGSKKLNKNPCIKFMIKEAAKQKSYGTSVKNITEEIKENSADKKLFERCEKELLKMAKKKFYPPYSYYSVLKMNKNIKRLAMLTKNKDFVKKFKPKLLFPNYRSDLRKIFNEAVEVKNELEIIECRLKSIFNTKLPDTVIDVLVQNLKPKDLPLE